MKRTQTVNRLCLILGLYHLNLWILKEIANSYHNWKIKYNKKKNQKRSLIFISFMINFKILLIAKQDFKKQINTVKQNRTKPNKNKLFYVCLKPTVFRPEEKILKVTFCCLCLINSKHVYFLLILADGWSVHFTGVELLIHYICYKLTNEVFRIFRGLLLFIVSSCFIYFSINTAEVTTKGGRP